MLYSTYMDESGESVVSQREQKLFETESSERATYKPYDIDKRDRRDLGREQEHFEEWENLNFKDFVAHEGFDSPEAVVSYFLDHPQVNIKDSLTELLLDGRYDSFIESHFKGGTKLNAKALAEELSGITAELIILREKLKNKTTEINNVGSQAIELHLGYEPPPIDEHRILFVPSLDVYNYIASGTTKPLQQGDGTATYPIVPEGTNPDRTFVRMAIVPMAYTLQVDTTKITLTDKNAFKEAQMEQGRSWYKMSLVSASHESEHARVSAHLDYSQKELRAGFKSLPLTRDYSEKSMELRQDEKHRDEGMTDFLSVWKQQVAAGNLAVDATFDQIAENIGRNVSLAAYSHDVGNLIRYMKSYKEEMNIDDPLPYFLGAYYNSSNYPGLYV